MAVQTVFKRYELKYLLTTEQKTRVLAEIAPYMELDSYGRTTIRNLYYDTDTYLLIRRSIEKPAYKEKLRLRRSGRFPGLRRRPQKRKLRNTHLHTGAGAILRRPSFSMPSALGIFCRTEI